MTKGICMRLGITLLGRFGKCNAEELFTELSLKMPQPVAGVAVTVNSR